MRRTNLRPSCLAILTGLLATAAMAQEEIGNVFVVVTDVEGAALPGVTVSLEGLGAPRVQVTNAQGQARFLALDPGAWSLAAHLEGFSQVDYPNLDVRVARNTQVELTLPQAIEEIITVDAESPLLDLRKVSGGATISQVELEKLPTARDPWAVLSQVPGVLVDRVNVGGNESGSQSTFTAPGVLLTENAFLIDGVEITDMASLGTTSTYFDFDQFAEAHFSTGGSDVLKPNAGVSVNLVTKRGTNEFRGSARFLRTDDNYFNGFLEQKVPLREQPDQDLAPNQASFVGNSINQVTEYGFEAGGPMVEDHLWFWGSWGTNDIRNRTGGATLADVQASDIVLENTALRINAQLSSANSLLASWNSGDKRVSGTAAGPTRPAPTTWDQRGPFGIYKLEDSHIVNSNLFLSATWSHVDSGFSLTSKACIAAGSCAAAPETAWDANGVWQNSYLSGSAGRPQDESHLDGSYFFTTGAASHEIKFGGRLRQVEATSVFVWPGRDVFVVDLGLFDVPGNLEYVVAARTTTPPISQEYTSLWAQDTLSMGNLTANLGLRYDLQEGAIEAAAVPGNPVFPELLPPFDYPGASAPFDWENITPRLGVTYAAGEERQTLLRASFSQFPEQLGAEDILHLNPFGTTYVYHYFYDLDGDLFFEDGEPLVGVPYVYGPSGATLETPNQLAGDYEAPITSEAILGVEHAVLPEFVVGVHATYRLTVDPTSNDRPILIGADGLPRPATAADYVPDGFVEGTLPDGTPYSVPVFAIGCAPDCLTGGRFLENTDREVEYKGVALTAVKRLSKRWMMRGHVNYGETQWRLGDEFVRNDDPNDLNSGEDDEGGVFGQFARGFMVLESTWQVNVNGMVQVAPDRPWGFNLAANVFGRDGYPRAYYHAALGSDGAVRNIQATEEVDSFRAESPFVVDARIEKEFTATGNAGLTFSIDVFNLFDEAYVMRRRSQLNQSQADWLTETLSPRIYRLGVRLSWR